jgi:hypothetical protein
MIAIKKGSKHDNLKKEYRMVLIFQVTIGYILFNPLRFLQFNKISITVAQPIINASQFVEKFLETDHHPINNLHLRQDIWQIISRIHQNRFGLKNTHEVIYYTMKLLIAVNLAPTNQPGHGAHKKNRMLFYLPVAGQLKTADISKHTNRRKKNETHRYCENFLHHGHLMCGLGNRSTCRRQRSGNQ